MHKLINSINICYLNVTISSYSEHMNHRHEPPPHFFRERKHKKLMIDINAKRQKSFSFYNFVSTIVIYILFDLDYH